MALTDTLTPLLVERFRGMLGHAKSDIIGDVPFGIHWCLAPWPVTELDVDGRPRRDHPRFPGLTSEMWAGAETEFLAPLRPGDIVVHESKLASIDEKQGRAGKLVFVTEEHEYSVSGEVRIRELWKVVFRAPGSIVPSPAGPAPSGRIVIPNSVMLFQYSALTYNAHRVHFDHPYATEVERYPGLVVHGPLTATLLLDTCATEFGPIGKVSLRAEGPAYGDRPLYLHAARAGKVVELAARDDRGASVMTGRATLV